MAKKTAKKPQKPKRRKKPLPAAVQKLTPKQQTFVELVLVGYTDVAAYMKAFECSRSNAESNAWRMKDDEGVRAAVQAGREETWGDAVLSVKQKRAFLKLAIETPPEDVDESSVLCQEWTYETKGGEARGRLKRGKADRGNEVAEERVDTVKVKMVDKMRAIALDNDLAGDGSEANGQNALADLMKHLRK